MSDYLRWVRQSHSENLDEQLQKDQYDVCTRMYSYVLKHPVRATAPLLFKTCQRITAKTIINEKQQKHLQQFLNSQVLVYPVVTNAMKE